MLLRSRPETTTIHAKNDNSEEQSLAASSDCSLPAQRQCCDLVERYRSRSSSVGSSVYRSASACGLCDDNRQCCQAASEGNQCPEYSICVDPNCSVAFCETCFDLEEYCEGHFEDCGLDCGVCINCDGPDCGSHDDLFFRDSYSELFGDRAAGTFGLGSSPYHLPTEIASVERGSFHFSSKQRQWSGVEWLHATTEFLLLWL